LKKKVGLGFIAIIVSGVFAATMMLSTSLTDSVRAADDGPNANVSQLASVKELEQSVHQASINKGLLYEESSVVRGAGEVSIKGSFDDRAMGFNGWMKGAGSINLESLRSMNENRPRVNFTQMSDLIFEGGQLKGEKSLNSPQFYRGIGASIIERFNLSHVDKSEIDMIRSINRSDNTLALNAEQAFDGTWFIKTQQGWSFNRKKSEERYSGSFQTQKNIELQDLGKK
jgi:hypothetical protein